MVPARFHWFDDRNGRRLLCASPHEDGQCTAVLGTACWPGAFFPETRDPPWSRTLVPIPEILACPASGLSRRELPLNSCTCVVIPCAIRQWARIPSSGRMGLETGATSLWLRVSDGIRAVSALDAWVAMALPNKLKAVLPMHSEPERGRGRCGPSRQSGGDRPAATGFWSFAGQGGSSGTASDQTGCYEEADPAALSAKDLVVLSLCMPLRLS